jgi:hypothetical protein
MKKLILALTITLAVPAMAGTYEENLLKVSKDSPVMYQSYLTKTGTKLLFQCITFSKSEFTPTAKTPLPDERLVTTGVSSGSPVLQILINQAQDTCSKKNANLTIVAMEQ